MIRYIQLQVAVFIIFSQIIFINVDVKCKFKYLPSCFDFLAHLKRGAMLDEIIVHVTD
jgi:hypothetical protein